MTLLNFFSPFCLFLRCLSPDAARCCSTLPTTYFLLIQKDFPLCSISSNSVPTGHSSSVKSIFVEDTMKLIMVCKGSKNPSDTCPLSFTAFTRPLSSNNPFFSGSGFSFFSQFLYKLAKDNN